MKRNGLKSLTSSCSCLLGLALVAALTACAGASIPPIKTYTQASEEVEKQGLAASKPIEAREGYKEGKSQVIDQNVPTPYKGVLLDEDKASYYIAVKAERDRRLKELDAARKSAAIKQLIYESTIDHLSAKLTTRAGWWEQNKGLVGFSIGVAIGMAIVTGLVYGLTRGSGVGSSGTNTHVLVPVR